ncbi:MAG: 3-oxoacyl-ACP reductase FabG [Thiotrichales bacterium]|jgi:3-oxoacyl-[acyl-carrier protein] reductase|nr:3-oxoacyl-ACP reductase FabG [Thiotrichales bacterium]
MKYALVTGGSGAIGESICIALAQDGYHVVVHANQNLDRAKNIADVIIANGGLASAVCFDVSDEQQTKANIEQLLEKHTIQVLVNNAGIHDDAPLAGMSSVQWHRVIDVSLNGFYNVTQPLLLPMMATRWGRIINVASVAGIMGNRGQANYAAAKAGLIGATKSLAQEVASRNILVNAIAPGIITSPMTDSVFDQTTINRIVPQKRAGTPEEVANLVSFLASDKASYISGQVISVNGGMV